MRLPFLFISLYCFVLHVFACSTSPYYHPREIIQPRAHRHTRIRSRIYRLSTRSALSLHSPKFPFDPPVPLLDCSRFVCPLSGRLSITQDRPRNILLPNNCETIITNEHTFLLKTLCHPIRPVVRNFIWTRNKLFF